MRAAPLRFQPLSGPPAARGAAQAALAGIDVAAVRAAIEMRFSEAEPVLAAPPAATYLARQMAFAREHCAPEVEEFEALCNGYGLDPAVPFALLHLSILSGAYETDGCTAWARPLPEGGAVLVKNRDLSGRHRSFQEIFRHDDPAARSGAVLAVGTLGAPGVYSSGLNAKGLALADTAIAAPQHRVGWLRYFLMTRLAFACATVEEACDLVATARHAGGGSLILADAAGAVASVELLADGARIDRAAPAFRTNHFLSETLEAVAARQGEAAFRSTTGRLAQLEARLHDGLGLAGLEAVAEAMADHGDHGREGFCRHGQGDASHTVSTAIYLTSARSLHFARGRPCEAAWEAGHLAARGEGDGT